MKQVGAQNIPLLSQGSVEGRGQPVMGVRDQSWRIRGLSRCGAEIIMDCMLTASEICFKRMGSLLPSLHTCGCSLYQPTSRVEISEIIPVRDGGQNWGGEVLLHVNVPLGRMGR